MANFISNISIFIGSYIVAYLRGWELALIVTSCLPILGLGGYIFIMAISNY
jgi:hypothetical protein